MQGQDHLYFLLDDMNRSLYVENGIVQRSATPRPLQFTPDGWRKIKVENQRNQKYFALDRMYTVPLEFVEDGALILKYMYYTYGVEVKVFLGILKQKLFYDGAQYGYYHDKFIKGEIDFSNFNRSGPKVTVNIMEGGLSKLIKNRENNKYEFDIDVPQAVKMKMDGVDLYKRGSYVISPLEIKKSVYGTNFFFPVNYVNSEGESTGLNFVTQNAQNVSGIAFDTKKNLDNKILNGDSGNITDVAVNIKGVIKFQCTVNDPGLGFRARFLTSTQTIPTQFAYDVFSVGPVIGQIYEFPVNTIINVQPGEKVHLEGIFFGGITGAIDVGIVFLEGSKLEAEYVNRYRTTYCLGLPPEYVFKKLIEKITDGSYQGESPVLATNYDFVLTCGDALRRIPGAKLKLSLSDFFQSFNTQFDIGMGEIAGKVRLDEKHTFIDYSNPIDLGEVSKFKDKPATEYYFSTLKIGYPEQDYDNVNGKQEFNNTVEYTTPITRITKEYNLVSAFRADCYGAEFTRINLEGKTTTDSDSDNDVWIIHTKKTPVVDPIEGTIYELNRDLNAFATGLLSPQSVFNLYLSPRRCLERNGRYLHSGFYKMDTGALVYQTTQKNASLTTTNPVVVEKSNVTIGNLLGRLFQPELLECDTPAPIDLVELLEASPVRAFKGTYLGIPFDGIPVKVGIAASDYEAQTYTLLASPTMDFTLFIELVE